MADKIVRIIVTASDQTQGAFASVQGRLASLGQGMMTWGTRLTLGVTAPIVAMFTAVTEKTLSVESAFAGVTKTTDGLTTDMGELNDVGKALKDEFLALSETKPFNAEELMRIGELAGQLGVPKDALIAFTAVVADLGATTDLSTEEAAMGFARIINIMGLAQDDVDEMGASIVDLGNNFATTEPEILDFALRIAGAGKVAGMSTADIFGIAAAFSSVGLQAEAGGSSVQRVILEMNAAVADGGDKLKLFASTAGMSAEEFARVWRTDPGAAFTAFTEGLGREGVDATGVLDDLELSNIRVTRAFLSIGEAGGLLTDSLNTSKTAWKENSALTKEANIRYTTGESQLKLLRNQLNNVALKFGTLIRDTLPSFIALIEPVIEKIGDLAENHGTLALKIGLVAAAIGPAMALLGGIVSAAGLLATPVGAAAVAIGLLAAAFIKGNGGIKGTLGKLDEFKTKLETETKPAVADMERDWTIRWGVMRDVFNEIWDDIAQHHAETWSNMVEDFNANMTLIGAINDTASSEQYTVWDVAFGQLRHLWGLVWPQIKTKNIEDLNTINTAQSTALGVLTGLNKTQLAIQRGDWEGAWEGIRATAQAGGDGVQEVERSFFQTYLGVFGINVRQIEADTDSHLVAQVKKFQGKYNQLKTWFTGYMTQWKADIKADWEVVKTTIVTPFRNAADWISEKWSQLSDWWVGAQGWWTTMITKLGEKKQEVVDAITKPFKDAKTFISVGWSRLPEWFGGAAGWLTMTITKLGEKKQSVIDALAGPFLTAKNFVVSYVTAIQTTLDSIRVPHIPTPHFSLTTENQSIAGISVPVPKINVSWYAKGLDAIFDQPTLIGVGEAGPERVVVQPLGKGSTATGTEGGEQVTNNYNLNVAYPILETQDNIRDTLRMLQMVTA